MLARVPVWSCGPSVQVPLVPLRYCRSYPVIVGRAGVHRRRPGHVEARGAPRSRRHRRRRGHQRDLGGIVGDGDGHRDRIGAAVAVTRP